MGRGVALHLSYTVAAASWLSNSHSPHGQWLWDQALPCLCVNKGATHKPNLLDNHVTVISYWVNRETFGTEV